MHKTGIVICSRLNSRRIPNKAFHEINNIPLLEHLINRLIKTDLDIILAVPLYEYNDYLSLKNKFPGKVHIFRGSAEDPLARMFSAARHHKLNTIIRVCHDKVFIDDKTLFEALNVFHSRSLDYLYSSKFTKGSSFEIISRESLDKAAQKFKKVEHISYAIKNVTKNILDYDINPRLSRDYRFLVDYPEDLALMQLLLSDKNASYSLANAIQYMDNHPWAKNLNKLPEITIYTCAYNAEKWVDHCMASVEMQAGFNKFEYILIDDASTDNTTRKMAQFKSAFKNTKWIRNSKNLGLAASSNVALSEAKGDYIIRLDADDLFCNVDSVNSLLREIKTTKKDVIYPGNYYGSYDVVQSAKDECHIGGAIFCRNAVNHIKFNDKLRNLEGYDFFTRAKDQLNIGYMAKPTFFYRQHDDSMSKTNLEEREQTRRHISHENGLQLI